MPGRATDRCRTSCCRSASRSSCSRRSPIWSTSTAGSADRRNGLPPTCSTCSSSPSCWPARSSNTMRWRASSRAMPAARLDDISAGFLRFMIGVAKKTLIADTLGTGADQIFAAEASALGFAQAWCGVIFFTFQIYFDFSGYSDMAIGIARMLGFRLRENFDLPYIALQHHRVLAPLAHLAHHLDPRISLHPARRQPRLAGPRIYFNLWICFLASGLWHGAAWTYVAVGRLQRAVPGARPAVPAAPAGPAAAACRKSHHLRHRRDRLDDLPRPSWGQAIAFLRAMVQPGLPSQHRRAPDHPRHDRSRRSLRR